MIKIVTRGIALLVVGIMMSTLSLTANAAPRTHIYNVGAHKKTTTGVIFHCLENGKVNFDKRLVLERREKGSLRCKQTRKIKGKISFGITAYVPENGRIRVYVLGVKDYDKKIRSFRGRDVVITRGAPLTKVREFVRLS